MSHVTVRNIYKTKRINLKKIEKAALFILQKMKLKNKELSIVFCSDNQIKKLNRKYRKINKPTDVLSFYVDTKIFKHQGIIGDIIISLDKARKQAKDQDILFMQEVYFLLVHGLLHLLGFDHIRPKDKEKMFIVQDSIFKSLLKSIH